jgi:hypothetical protein
MIDGRWTRRGPIYRRRRARPLTFGVEDLGLGEVVRERVGFVFDGVLRVVVRRLVIGAVPLRRVPSLASTEPPLVRSLPLRTLRVSPRS